MSSSFFLCWLVYSAAWFHLLFYFSYPSYSVGRIHTFLNFCYTSYFIGYVRSLLHFDSLLHIISWINAFYTLTEHFIVWAICYFRFFNFDFNHIHAWNVLKLIDFYSVIYFLYECVVICANDFVQIRIMYRSDWINYGMSVYFSSSILPAWRLI